MGASKLANGSVSEAKIAAGAVSPAKLSTPGVDVRKGAGSFYCVELHFVASGGAVSTTASSKTAATAEVSVPADSNCDVFPGYIGAAV